MDTGWVMVVWCVKFSFYPLSCLLKPKGNKKFLLGRTRYTENMRKSLFILLSCSNKFSYEMCYMSSFHFLLHIQRQIISMVPNFASFWSPIRIIWLILFSWDSNGNHISYQCKLIKTVIYSALNVIFSPVHRHSFRYFKPSSNKKTSSSPLCSFYHITNN